MTTKAEREVLLQGQDPIANAIIGYLVERGWSNDYILKNVVSKEYLPHRAVLRVELDSENKMYYIQGEYVSEGHNVLVTCTPYIKVSDTAEERTAKMDRFLQDAEKSINGSFAVRFLGPNSKM